MSSSKQLHVRNPPETTSRLLEAAAAEFVRHGYDRARVSDIARNAGYTVGSIYARWPNKSDLMVAALDHLLAQILPEHRFKDLNIGDLPPLELLLAWGADQLDPDSPREVFAQAFGSARNNPDLQECLREFLNESFSQTSRLVEHAKAEGQVDAELNTAAIVLFIQAVGIGVHMIRSSGLDEAHLPPTSDWIEFNRRLSEAALPRQSQ